MITSCIRFNDGFLTIICCLIIVYKINYKKIWIYLNYKKKDNDVMLLKYAIKVHKYAMYIKII